MMRAKQAIAIAMGVLVWAPGAWGGPNNSIFQREADQDGVRNSRGGLATGPGRPIGAEFGSSSRGVVSVQDASWIRVDVPRPRDYRVYDLVEIIVQEVSRSSTKANNKTERENTIDAVLKDWLRLSDGNLRPDRQSRGDPTISAAIEREFEGKADEKRVDTLTVRIQATVVDVLPNGNMVLEAVKEVGTDDDITRVTLTGMCRSTDISAANTISSEKIANMNLYKTHRGSARDAMKRGFISRIWDTFNPF